MTSMTTTIWKYPLQIANWQSVTMPRGARILCAQMLPGQGLNIWAQLDPEAKPIQRRFRIYGTGHAHKREEGQYVGTVQDGPFVWHVFDLGDGEEM